MVEEKIVTEVKEIIFFNLFAIALGVLIQFFCEWYDKRRNVPTISRKVMTIVVIFTLVIINTLWVGVILGEGQT